MSRLFRVLCLASILWILATPLSVAARRQADLGSQPWKDELSRGYAPYRQLSVDEFPIDDRVESPSWRRSSVALDTTLITHEHGHLDINEAYAAMFARVTLPSGQGATSEAAIEDLRLQLKAICDGTLKAAQVEQDKYDLETRHGNDHEQQAAWTEALRKRLRDLKVSLK